MKKKTTTFLALLAFAFAFSATASGKNAPDDLMNQANQAYIDGDYAGAIALYGQIANMGLESASLYYNLGNAYYNDRQLGKAIVNYERALRLDRRDDAIQHNLQIARNAIEKRVEPLPRLFFLEWHDAAISRLTPDGWAWFAIAFVSLSALFVAAWVAAGRIALKRGAAIASLVMLFLALSCLYAAQSQYNGLYDAKTAIITTSEALAQSAPGDRGRSLFTIHEGNRVEIRSELNGWYEVRLANGEVGWIRNDQLEVV